MLWIVTEKVIITLCDIWLVISIYWYIKDRSKKTKENFDLLWLVISNIFMPLFFLVISLIIYFIIGVVINTHSTIIEEYKYTTPIYCLNDNSKIEGKSYLFSGYINQKMVYRTIYTDSYGGKKMWEIDANKSSVFEDGQNKIVVYGEKFENPKTEYWLKGTAFNICKSETRYEVHIPKDSITTEYNIDLK